MPTPEEAKRMAEARKEEVEKLKAELRETKAELSETYYALGEVDSMRRREKRRREKAEKIEGKIDALGKRFEVMSERASDAMQNPTNAARDAFHLVEAHLTPDERSLRDWLQAGGTGRGWESAKGMSHGKASSLHRSIVDRYKAAGLEPPFTRSQGGRPRKVQIVNAGTVEAAEGIARKAGGAPSA